MECGNNNYKIIQYSQQMSSCKKKNGTFKFLKILKWTSNVRKSGLAVQQYRVQGTQLVSSRDVAQVQVPANLRFFFYDSGKSLGAVFHSKSLTALYFFFFKKSNSKFSLNPGPVPHLSKSTATLRCHCQYGTELYLRQNTVTSSISVLHPN